MSKFLASGEGLLPPSPPVGKTLRTNLVVKNSVNEDILLVGNNVKKVA